MSQITIADLRTLADAVCELDAAKGYFITTEQARIEELIGKSFRIIESIAGREAGLIFDQSNEITYEQALGFARELDKRTGGTENEARLLSVQGKPLIIPDDEGPVYKVIYMGASDAQVNWGGNDDPRGLLEEGKEYEVENEEVHSWHTKLYLKDFPGKKFNSVCFKPKDGI